MKTEINEFLEVQIEAAEEICGEFTDDDKQFMKNDFFNKFEKIASEFGVDVNLIYENFENVMIPIYESDFDMNVAAEVILATGGDY